MSRVLRSRKTFVGAALVCLAALLFSFFLSGVMFFRVDEAQRTAEQRFELAIAAIGSYETALGNELILGLRWTDDFGPVVTIGAGGVYTEFLSENFKSGRDVVIVSPESSSELAIERALHGCAATRLITTPMRGRAPRIDVELIRGAKWNGCGRICAIPSG